LKERGWQSTEIIGQTLGGRGEGMDKENGRVKRNDGEGRGEKEKMG